MTSRPPDRLRRLAASLQVPRTLTSAGLRDRFGDPGDQEPASGQVWRAEWDGMSRLVLLLAAEERRWRVVPVSVEPTGEDDRSLVVDADHTAFPVEVTAWAGLAVSIPTGTLGRLIDQWSDEVRAWCADAAEDELHEPPVGARLGLPIADPYSGSATVRASLADELDAFVAAPLVPVQVSSAVIDLKVAAVEAGLPKVIAALGVPPQTVMKIVQGKWPVTEPEAQVLAELFGYSVEDIMATAGGFPVDLATELEQPRWRTAFQSIARRLGIGEFAVRLQAGYGAYATAFRQTGVAGPDWRGRIGQWITVEEDEIQAGGS